ncbi:MAG: AI-2E family transporter, partial [Acidobacteriota bacterium]
GVFSILDRFGIDLGQQPFLERLQALPILDMLKTTAGTVATLLSTGLMTLIFVIYLLLGRQPNRLRTGLYADMDLKIRRYVVTKVATSAATGILVGTILALFGLDLALVFGVMAFLLNFIPSIGSILSTLLPIPMAIVQFESIWMIAGVIIVPGVIQVVIGSGIEPKIMGEGLELHPVTILLALVFWGLLWGVVGMLLAAPITAVAKLVMQRFEMTRPAADLLAGRLPSLAPASGS